MQTSIIFSWKHFFHCFISIQPCVVFTLIRCFNLAVSVLSSHYRWPCFYFFFFFLVFHGYIWEILSIILLVLDNVWKFSPGGIYLIRVNSENTRPVCEICSKLAIKTPERCYWRHSGVFIVNFKRQWRCFSVFIVSFEQIPHIALVFLFFTLKK